MPISLPIALIILALLVLGSLFIWRVRTSRGQAAAAPPVAAANHKSVRSFRYAPMPVVEPGAAAPALAADSALTRLMAEDEFKVKEERENQAESDRIEALEAEARQQQQAQQPAAAESPAAAPADESGAAPTVPTQPALPATAPAVVSVANLLSADDANELPAVAAPATSPAPPEPTDDEAVAPALFDNPLTAKAPTANDQENQRVGAELRRLKREALQTKAASEKAALTSLYPGR